MFYINRFELLILNAEQRSYSTSHTFSSCASSCSRCKRSNVHIIYIKLNYGIFHLQVVLVSEEVLVAIERKNK